MPARRDVVYDLWAPSLVWSRVSAAPMRQREEFGVAAPWENVEALATG